MTKRLFPQRRGFSLAGLLAAMSAGSVALLLGIGIVHRMMHCQQAASAFHQTEQTTRRLAGQFRDDVHAAESATVEKVVSGKPFLRLALPDGKNLTYEQQECRIVRLQTSSDGKVWREEYTFRRPTKVLLSLESRPDRVTLTLEEAEAELAPPQLYRAGSGAPPVALHVVATLGVADSPGRSEEPK
jgi:hypothetical protein